MICNEDGALEYLKSSHAKRINAIREHHKNADPEKVEQLLKHYQESSIEVKAKILSDLKATKSTSPLTKKERKSLNKAYKQELVSTLTYIKLQPHG